MSGSDGVAVTCEATVDEDEEGEDAVVDVVVVDDVAFCCVATEFCAVVVAEAEAVEVGIGSSELGSRSVSSDLMLPF